MGIVLLQILMASAAFSHSRILAGDSARFYKVSESELLGEEGYRQATSITIQLRISQEL